MFSIKTIFRPNYERYEGVRPINIYLLRLFYFLIGAFVASSAWEQIITYQGPWDRYRAMAICVWAAYGTLSVFGLIHPLKWLPIMIFMILYKSLWLIIVAYPLWRANELAGSPAEEMTNLFIGVPVAIIAVPWKYVFENYIYTPKENTGVR